MKTAEIFQGKSDAAKFCQRCVKFFLTQCSVDRIAKTFNLKYSCAGLVSFKHFCPCMIINLTYIFVCIFSRSKSGHYIYCNKPGLMCSMFFSELTCRNVTHSKQAHTRVSIHSPLLSLTVGLAAVIHEAGVVPFRACINDPVLRTHMALGHAW